MLWRNTRLIFCSLCTLRLFYWCLQMFFINSIQKTYLHHVCNKLKEISRCFPSPQRIRWLPIEIPLYLTIFLALPTIYVVELQLKLRHHHHEIPFLHLRSGLARQNSSFWFQILDELNILIRWYSCAKKETYIHWDFLLSDYCYYHFLGHLDLRQNRPAEQQSVVETRRWL